MSVHEDRICASCGRAFAWRKAWARDWEQVRYCSEACRRRKVRPVDRALEAAILELLAGRAAGATICPSEAARAIAPAVDPTVARAVDPTVARAVDPEEGDDAWRALMEPARRAARRLVAAGEVELTQRGRVVDPSTFRGPVRIRRRR
ncbi:MAG: DUF2256 and DUF3253 domain-containing protein [Nitriliruptor sp.]|nr:MAG: DUF2256 and DUF3253 domain-containing protein [Nitriliruptor sp.]